MTDCIELAHGGGGRLLRDLIAAEILPRFGAGCLASLPDGATLPALSHQPVFTTDGFVVHPPVFPGGDIGSLAVHGTVNDLAVSGALPRWLSLAMILEEGLPLPLLRTLLDSVQTAASRCGVEIVTGDTKVVRKGQCDGIYITSSGIGERLPWLDLDVNGIRPGDAILVSGAVGDHGMAVLAAREGIRIENGPRSDSAPVHRLVLACESLGGAVRFMRDPTRGGLAAVLNEMVEGRPLTIVLREEDVPVSRGTGAVAEMLGLDVLNVACEGRVVLVCDEHAAEGILAAWRALPEGQGAVRIGAAAAGAGRVVMDTVAGGRRIVDVPHGELLPRIC